MSDWEAQALRERETLRALGPTVHGGQHRAVVCPECALRQAAERLVDDLDGITLSNSAMLDLRAAVLTLRERGR